MSIGETGNERREFERHSVGRDVTIEIDGVRVPGRLVEYSEGGAFIKLGVDVSVMAGATIKFALADVPDQPAANVHRVAPEGVAVRFGTDKVAKFIEAWVQPHMARAATFSGEAGKRK